MCGTANHKSEHGHGGHPHHLFRVPAADAAAYEYLAKEKKAPATTTKRPADRKKSGDALTSLTRSTVDKCTSYFGEFQKSPAYK